MREDDVTNKFAELGDTKAKVIAALKGRGIKGGRELCTARPLARYLAQAFRK